MKNIRTLAGYIGVVLFVAIGITQCIEVSKHVPDNAVVYIDDDQKLYHSPIHFRDNEIEIPSNLRKSTVAEARSQEFTGDPVCKSRGYFSHERGSLLKATLSDWTGLASQPRWNEDGSWNW